MKDFMNGFKSKVQAMMTGRYGSDEFSKFLLCVTLVLLVISLLFGGKLFLILAIAGLVWAYFRIFSRNFAGRASENRIYLEKSAAARKTFRIQKKRFADRKEYKYFKCKSCGQEVRVPKGKGHIRITCPKCRMQFDRTV